MIHISGLGMAGTYLYRRLKDDGFEVEGYDPKRPDYYLPCGYATNEHLLEKYLKNTGMESEDYVITRATDITFSGNNFGEISFSSKGMCTIDKYRLERDLLGGYPGKRYNSDGNSDIRIDATGISRALLGPSESDYTMYAKEYLTNVASHNDFYFYFFRKGHGYFWEFPLGDRYHVGAGSDELDMIDERLSEYQKEKVTGRRIRLAPLFSSISKDNIIGVGEAIGTVSPISGEGIIPSIKSAEFLFQAMKKYTDLEKIKDSYINSVRKEFGYYYSLRALVKKIQQGQKLGLSEIGAARSAKKDLEMFGVDFKLSRIIGHFI